MVPVADPLVQGSLGRRSGRDPPLGLLHKLGIQMQELGFSFPRENRSTRRASLAALYIPALKDGAFRAIWVNARLKDEFGGRMTGVRGHAKVI
jgi:hypothetical protein